MSPRLSTPSLLLRYARPLWRRLLLLLVFLLVGSGLQLLGPHLVRYVIDGALGGAETWLLVAAGAGFLLLAIGNIAVAAVSTHLGADIGWRATNRLRSDLFHSALDRELSFHEVRTPGELLERIDSDPGVLFRFFSGLFVAAVANAMLVIGALVVLYRQRWWLAVAAAAFGVVMVLVLARLRGSAAPHYRDSREATTQQMAFVAERFAGIDDIRTSGAVEYTMARFLDVSLRAYRASRRARVAGDALGAVGSTMLKGGSVGGLAAGVYLHQRGVATVGTVYLIVQYAAMLSRPLNAASGQADEFQRAKVAAERVAELLPDAKPQPVSTALLPAGAFSVEASSVVYRYSDGPVALDNVSFDLAAGQTLALVGRTGAGKTTLARLLFGLDRPTSGTIRLAGVDTRDLSFEATRARVGFVTQQVQIVPGTLRDNLTLFDETVGDDRLDDSIAALGLTSWFQRLPGARHAHRCNRRAVCGVIRGGSSAGRARPDVPRRSRPRHSRRGVVSPRPADGTVAQHRARAAACPPNGRHDRPQAGDDPASRHRSRPG